MKYLSIIFVLLLGSSYILCSDLNIVCQWNQIDFDFPTPQDRTEAIRNKDFIQQNVVPIDVDAEYKGTCLLII